MYNYCMNILLIFLEGSAILLGAIILNALASVLGLMSWYEFLKNVRYPGLLNSVWLFVIYPFCLGLITYYSAKLLNL